MTNNRMLSIHCPMMGYTAECYIGFGFQIKKQITDMLSFDAPFR